MKLFRGSVGFRLYALLGALVALLVAVGGTGLYGVTIVNQTTESLAAKMESFRAIAKIGYLMTENRAQVALALQHDPSSPFSALHSHPLEQHTDAILKNRDEISAIWNRYMKRQLSGEERSMAEAFAAARIRYAEEGLAAAVEALAAGDYKRTYNVQIGKVGPLLSEAKAKMDKMEDHYKQEIDAELAASASAASSARIWSVCATALGTLLAAVSGFMIVRSIVRPLSEMSTSAELAIRNDDFTYTIAVSGNCELGRAARSFNDLTGKLCRVITETRTISLSLAEASQTLAQSTQQVTTGAHLQSEAASSVAAAVEQISVAVEETSEHARLSELAAISSQSETRQAIKITRESMADMSKVAQAIKLTTENVLQLSTSSEQISGIVGVIKEIAEQTNLLALNAAIEAARAGEQGRGFAVVADEVRKLAERTTKSTQEIGGIINTIQKQIGGAVTNMQMADSQATHSVEITRRAEDALQVTSSGGARIVERVKEIANAIKGQSQAIHEIAGNMEKIAQMTEESSAAAENNGQTASRLDNMAGMLGAMVERFKVGARA